jgi:hypothetical protein
MQELTNETSEINHRFSSMKAEGKVGQKVRGKEGRRQRKGEEWFTDTAQMVVECACHLLG